MSKSEAKRGILPPQGIASWYKDILRLLQSRSVPKVDKAFLQGQRIAKGNEYKPISGLKFLRLIGEDGSATEALNNLSLKGEEGKKNLEKVVRNAYSLIFEEAKINLETVDADILANCFRTDYGMGSPRTAEDAARIFVFLAQEAGISVSESIREKLLSSGKRKSIDETKKAGVTKRLKKAAPQTSVEGLTALLPEDVMARFILREVGQLDIRDEESFEILKGYVKLLSKRLGIPE